MVESFSEKILADADTKDIAFLVVGDPLGQVLPNTLQPMATANPPSPIEQQHTPTFSCARAVSLFPPAQSTMHQS